MIETERLLSPLSEAAPTGEFLRYEGTYDEIQTARKEDDPELSVGVWQTTLKKADWTAVRDLCISALEQRTKDLQIATWLLEALTRLDGFVGAREGLDVMTGLCELFWPVMHPQSDNGDIDFRLAPVRWVNEKLALQLKRLPVTEATRDVSHYCWADWENALFLEKLSHKDRSVLENAEAQGKVTQSKFLSAVSMSSTAFFGQLAAEVGEAIEAVARFEEVMERLAGEGAALHTFKGVLNSIEEYARGVLRERGVELDAVSTSAEAPETSEMKSSTVVPFVTPHIHSRAEAHQLLNEAAEYLLRTEPHSPAPYLVKRAVTWGNMTLVEVLQEVVRNGDELSELYRLLGVGPSSDGNPGYGE